MEQSRNQAKGADARGDTPPHEMDDLDNGYNTEGGERQRDDCAAAALLSGRHPSRARQTLAESPSNTGHLARAD